MPQKPPSRACDPIRQPVDFEPIPIDLGEPEPLMPDTATTGNTHRKSPVIVLGLALINFISGVMMPFAGPYRVLAYRLNTFPNVCGGILTWLGITAIFPVFFGTFTFSEPTFGKDVAVYGILLFWVLMFIATWVQGWARWSIERPRLDQAVSQSWAGSAEPVLVLAVTGIGWPLCGGGFSLFVVLGYLASTLQIRLFRLRMRLEAWSEEDSNRLLMPVRKVAASAGGTARTVATATGAVAVPALGTVKNMLRRPVAEGTVASAPTFWGWITRYLVGHTIFSLIFGGLSVGAIFSVGGFLLAIPLYLLGWELRPPEEERKRGQEFFQGVNEAFQEEREGWNVPFRKEREENRTQWDSEEDEPFSFEPRRFQ